jgi:hypothetical protein
MAIPHRVRDLTRPTDQNDGSKVQQIWKSPIPERGSGFFFGMLGRRAQSTRGNLADQDEREQQE